MRLLGQAGSFSDVFLNHPAGSRPLSLAVPSRLRIAVARRPARSEPANSQFFLPRAMGRMAFAMGTTFATANSSDKQEGAESTTNQILAKHLTPSLLRASRSRKTGLAAMH